MDNQIIKKGLIIISFIFIGVSCVIGERKYTNQDLETWAPSTELKRSFPYYLAGPDHDGFPVFVIEYGKWDVRKVVEKGTREDKETLEKYSEQMYHNFVKKGQEFKNNTDGDGGYAILFDMEGYDLAQVSHVPTITYTLKTFTLKFVQDFSDDLQWSIGINANYAAETFMNFIRPIAGALFAKAEIYGTNKEKWIPKLLRKLPRESLPSWYGGSKTFKPLAVYG